jgi:glycosyltransferase involved in cell wall biosynthesis
MKAIDLLALPSLWEGFGIVLIEAMAAGKPVVATRISSIPEIVIEGRTGLLVPVNDPRALARAFEQVFRLPHRAATWGKNGRSRVMQEFTLEKMLDRYECLFSSCSVNLNHGM